MVAKARYEAFKKLRRQHNVSAAIAYQWLLSREKPGRITWGDFDLDRPFEIDGWSVTISMSDDDWVELDYHGRFTDSPERGEEAIINPESWNDSRYSWLRGPVAGKFHYFVMGNSSISVERAALSKRGYSRHEAWLQAMTIARREMAYARGEGLVVVQLLVKVSRCGVDLAYESCGGIEVEEYRSDFLLAEINDLFIEAKDEASVKLRELCAAAG